jgi:hypothetical protein
MSSAAGLQIYRIPIQPVGQTVAQWSGSTTPITYLDIGTYYLTYNSAVVSSDSSMSNMYGIITKDALFAQPGWDVICASAKLSALGTVLGTTPLGFSISNTFVIDTDNTPIYLDLSITKSGGSTWGIPAGNTYNNNMNYIVIVKLA